MDKNKTRFSAGLGSETGREADAAQPAPAHFWISRLPLAVLLALTGVGAGCLLAGCTGTGRQPESRPQARHRPVALPPSELPPIPTNMPPVIRWEKGAWWGSQPGERASVSISNAGTQTIILGAAVSSEPRYMTVRDLSLAAPASEPLTLLLVKAGTERPLRVSDSCTVHTNTAVRIDDAALVVGGTLQVNGKLDLARGRVAANSELLIGGSDEAPASVHVRHGTLTVTNAHHDARLIIGQSGRGDFYLEGGTVEADFLQVTNNRNNRFIFTSGTLKVRSMYVTNYGPIVIGDGVHPALEEFSAGTNVISSLLTVTNNAVLMADGDVTISGPVANYGTIVAGQTNAHLTFASLLPGYPSMVTNWGRMFMTNGGVLTFLGSVSNFVSAPITGMPTKQPGGEWTVRFISVGGLTHTLEYKNALDEANWTPVASTMGTGEILSLTDPTSSNKARYYHIRVTQP
jgi:hypothetical protein